MATEQVDRFNWLAPRRPFDLARWPETLLGFPGYLDEFRLEELVSDDELVIRAELPGIDPDKDLHITVSDHMLRVSAERHERKEATEKGKYRSEFRYGTFERRVALPTRVSEHDVKATYEDGILEVRLPIDCKTTEATKIPVQRV
jgi:HSP20 family protein